MTRRFQSLNQTSQAAPGELSKGFKPHKTSHFVGWVVDLEMIRGGNAYLRFLATLNASF